MSKIRILSDALASQVAAGEVVERPAAVIRELVENSLDAKAKHIEVHVQRGGTALVRVVDDGCGMEREDALLCIERHATSKIRTKEDLAAIYTFGFRGEALPSIASVSRFRLATREATALSGTEIEINGGKLVHVRDHGGAPGTVIEIRSLFFNVPARRKFLRTEATEYSHVEQQFRMHAIANPQVAFSLTKDGEVMYHLPATQDVLERIRGLAGDELASRMIEVPREEARGIAVWGYIGGAGLSRSSRQQQLTFLNGRPIESPSIHYGLREGYHTALMKGQHPVTFLFLEMDAHAFDINVHPAKKEVRFHDGHAVREVVARAVSKALAANTKLPSGHPSMKREDATRASGFVAPTPMQAALAMDVPISKAPLSTGHTVSSTAVLSGLQARSEMPERVVTPARSSPALPVHRRITDEADQPGDAEVDDNVSSSPPNQEDRGESGAPVAIAKTPMPHFRILGVLHKLYVLMESDEGLVMMDQHAAHERVNFEKMRKAMETGGVPTQRLLMPLTLQVSPRDGDVLKRNLDALARLGIEMDAFGPNIFKIEALPTFIKTDDPLAWLDQVIEELSSLSAKSSALRLGEDMIATTVCRHSVKANDRLSVPELEGLLRDLFDCEMPYCCPHGRPTLVQISSGELEKKFGRRAP